MFDILYAIFERKSKPQENQQTQIQSSGCSLGRDPYFRQFHLKTKKPKEKD